MARRPTNRDLVELTVLALLLHGPRHPYELHRFVIDTHKDYVAGLPRSLYHAVERLAADELITPVETVREGRRPERTVYEITAEGRASLRSRLRRLLETPDTDSVFLGAAVSLIGVLPPEVATLALRTRATALESLIVNLEGQRSTQLDAGLPRILLLEVECELAVRTAELDWIRGLIEDVGSGRLDWSVPPGQGSKERTGVDAAYGRPAPPPIGESEAGSEEASPPQE